MCAWFSVMQMSHAVIKIPDIVCRCFETVGLMDDDFQLVVEAFHDALSIGALK